VSDDQVKEFLADLIDGDGLHYGYVKLTHALRRQFRLVINKKKVYRLCREMRILKPQRKARPKGTHCVARNRVITGSNQLWETDIKYGYVAGQGQIFYVASVLDVYDRGVVAYHVGLECGGKSVLQTVRKALRARDCLSQGVVLRSDNGPQFKAKTMRRGCNAMGVEQEYIPCKTPNANAHIESFHAILEAECFAGVDFSTYVEALTAVHEFMRFYNNRRLHSACGYRPPAEYYQAYLEGTEPPKAMNI